MMNKLSRREFFYFSAFLSLLFPLPAYPINGENKGPRVDCPKEALTYSEGRSCLLHSLKSVLDPNGIISPGRYGIKN